MSHCPAIRALLYTLPLFFALSLTGRAAGLPQEKKASGSPPKTDQTVDACALLMSAELQATIGELLEEARPSGQPAGRIRTSQCFFRTSTLAKSVSLTVATPDRSSSSALREFWRNQFHSARQNEEEELPAAERGKTQAAASQAKRQNDDRKPRAIEGLGDEAFWVGSSISGALYVLQDNAFLRVSVGGIPDESSRLARSKRVASAALARLRSTLPTAASSLHK